jgi:hypothetical protein
MITKLTGDSVRVFPIIAVDTEDDSNGNVTLIDFCFDSGKGIEHFTTPSLEEAHKFIYLKRKQCVFVAHNLEYDIINLFRDSNYKHIRQLTYTSRLIAAKLVNLNHRFIDSFNFFPGTLKKMGETVGLTKGILDPNSIEYVQMDTLILYTFMIMFQKTVNALDLELGSTIGKLAMNAFRKHHLSREYLPYNEQDSIDSYFGGRCELFWKGEIEGDIRYADVNSMYPTAMCKNMPDTNCMGTITDLDCIYGFANVTVNVPHDTFVPVLPVRMSGLMFPTGRIRGTWTLHEIRRAIEKGATIEKFHSGSGTNVSCKPFNSYVDSFYAKRLSGESDFIKTFYKLVLNNLYGKFSQRNSYVECRNRIMSDEEENEKESRLIRVYGNLYFYECPLLEPPISANYAWGTYITAYSRLILERLLTESHEHSDLLYCDTDSVLYRHTGKDLDFDFHQTRLGALKEERFKFANFCMPKGYMLKGYDDEWKVACKGVPLPREFDKSKTGTLENPQVRFMSGEKVFVQKPLRLRSSFASSSKANVWKDMSKQSHQLYTRREVRGIGPTFPRDLSDIFV